VHPSRPASWPAQLFEERDAELARYDAAFAELGAVAAERDARLESLNVALAAATARAEAAEAKAREVSGPDS
jgi:hypothetical protein